MKRMLTRKPFSKMAGLTLLETMFALAVGALVLIGAVIFYMSTKQSGNVSKAAGDSNAIVSAIENYTAQGNSLGSVGQDLTVLQGAGYLPNPMLDPWGQEYTIAIAGASGTSATVTVTIPGIGGTADSDNNCTAIKQTLLGSATDASKTGSCAFTFPL